MTVQLRQKIERLIVERVLKCAFDNRFTVVIDNGGEPDESVHCSDLESAKRNIMETDEDKLQFLSVNRKYSGFVQMVYGNEGYDVIADYSIRLEETIKPALDLCDKLESGEFKVEVAN